jgi:hypothetical protein
VRRVFTRGFVFIFIASSIFWGYYFLFNKRTSRTNRNSYEIMREASRNHLEASISVFHEKEGRYPLDLQELVEKGYFRELPYNYGEKWEYNINDGTVK